MSGIELRVPNMMLHYRVRYGEMAARLEQRPVISEGAVRLVSIDFTPDLDDGELLAEVGSITEVGTITIDADTLEETVTASADLTITNESVSEEALVILRKSVAAGKAVQFLVSGQQAGSVYLIEIPVTSDSTPEQTRVVQVVLTCV